MDQDFIWGLGTMLTLFVAGFVVGRASKSDRELSEDELIDKVVEMRTERRMKTDIRRDEQGRVDREIKARTENASRTD